ncbi:MAG: hypothetical protein RXQ77_03385 [Candidatus Nanopusillus sp.]
MALDDVVKNAFNGLSTDPNLGQQVYNAIISSITDAVQVAAKQIDTQLDPKVNKSLKYTIEGFSINSIKDNIDPSQLYKDMVNMYKQNISQNKTSNIHPLSRLLIENYKKLGHPDPITGKREYATRQERETAQNIANIIEELLGQALTQYYNSIGRTDVTSSQIMMNIKEYASVFYGAYMGTIDQIGAHILSLTPDISLLKSATGLMSTLDGMYISSIQGLISTLHSKLPIPEALSLILNASGQKGLYNNIFDEMTGKIRNYIGQQVSQLNMQQPAPVPIQQNQPVAQPVQQVNQPNILPQQPGNQLQQNQQNNQVPSPHVIRPY